jgi:hypothetical protein
MGVGQVVSNGEHLLFVSIVAALESCFRGSKSQYIRKQMLIPVCSQHEFGYEAQDLENAA